MRAWAIAKGSAPSCLDCPHCTPDATVRRFDPRRAGVETLAQAPWAKMPPTDGLGSLVLHAAETVDTPAVFATSPSRLIRHSDVLWAAGLVGGTRDKAEHGWDGWVSQRSSRPATVRREYRRLSPMRRRTETGSLVARPWPRRLWGLHMAHPRHEREG